MRYPEVTSRAHGESMTGDAIYGRDSRMTDPNGHMRWMLKTIDVSILEQ
jgi:hypothetical protein